MKIWNKDEVKIKQLKFNAIKRHYFQPLTYL